MPTAPVLIESCDGVSVCHLEGELDAYAAPAVRDALSSVAEESAVVIVLRDVRFIDSSGLGVLVGAVRRVRELGGCIVLCSPTPAVARALAMVGLPRIVDVVADLESARRLVARAVGGGAAT